MTVENTTASALENLTAQVNFTTNSGAACGVVYLPSTAVGAQESDISDPASPVFSLGSLAPGETLTFSIGAQAPCSTVACIDGGEFFNNQIGLDWDGGSSSATSNPYIIERALLVITGVNSSILNGSQGQVVLRSITIANTRPGALQGFLFSDNNQGGISISSSVGTDISTSNTAFQLALDGSDFTGIGDGDGLFELNESITITEEITVLDCGVDIPSTVSDITVGWGCGGEICQQISTNAIVAISPSEQEPNLIWEPITRFAECFCGPGAYRQGMKITNAGDGAANDLVFDLMMLNNDLSTPFGWIDTGSVVVDSLGFLLDIQPGFSYSFSLPDPCTGLETGTPSFILTIPDLGPAQTVTVFWDVYFCGQGCKRPQVEWRYRYSYFKDCPPAPFVIVEDYIPVRAEGVQMNSGLDVEPLEPNEPMVDGSELTATFSLDYDSLTLLDDELVLEFELPCGLTWDEGNELLINGQSPLSLVQDIGTGSTLVTAIYQLPLNANEVDTQFGFVFNCGDLCQASQTCKDSVATTCAEVPCNADPPPALFLDATATIVKCSGFPLPCNMQSCRAIRLPYDCPIDSVCVSKPPGYAKYSFAAGRSNFGLPDNDNDRLADAGGTIDLSLVRTDRLIAGDTIHASLTGEVVIDAVGATLPFARVEMSFLPSMLTMPNVQNLLKEDAGISELASSLRIFDRSSGTYFDCENPAHVIVDTSAFTFVYDISATALGACVPAGFAFAEGDSILFDVDYRIEYNIVREIDAEPLWGKIILSPSMVLFDADSSDYEPVNCSCAAQVFEISAYEYTLLPGVFGVPPCQPSGFVGGSLFRLQLHESNFFPFEHRNLLVNEDWRVGIPPEVVLSDARLTFLRYQDGSVIASDEALSPVFSGGGYLLDFGQFQDPPLDEGFSALFQYIFESECDISGSLPFAATTNIDFADGLPEEEDPLELTVEANALRALIPNLSVEALLFNQISFDNQLDFDFTLANFSTNVAAQSSGIAPNVWLWVESPSGLVTDFALFYPLTGNEVPAENGVFLLGDLPVDTIALRLTATNNSCETEGLVLHYGWDCEPFNSQVQTPCYERTQAISITSPPGEIDFLVDSPAGCYDLCDTVPYHRLEIFNGQFGAVYRLSANAQLPPGLSVLAGSSQVEYPTGSGNFFPIADPEIVNNTIAHWDLAALDSLAEGLPGIGSAPANSISLQFLTTTDCGFVAGAFTLFSIAAEQNCGIPTNTVAKPGEPICINGITQPYSANISVETQTGIGCSDEVVFEFSMTASDDLPAGAVAIVSLPPGISFVPNSASSICQNNFDPTPETDGNTYIWHLPEGVASNQIICFGFATAGWSALGCEEGLVVFRTANETQALCAETGEMCSTLVNTGSLLFPFEILRPEFSLENFSVSASQMGSSDNIGFSIDIINCGAQNEPPITVDFFIDNDGDGAGDQLVHSEELLTVLSGCQSATMSGSFNVPAGNLCNLVAYINSGQCACSIDSASVAMPIEYQTGQSPTVCSGDEIMVGVAAVPGFTYQWQPSDCIQNPNSAMSVFSCENSDPFPFTYQFTLAETDGGTCQIDNLINVTLQPVPGIAFAETPVCAGAAANIAATDGAVFQWEGPGISDPNLQIQTVSPSATSVYSVSITDAFGCTGTDMATIEVSPLPVADAGADIMVCPGQMPQLNAAFAAGLDYLWSPALVNGLPALNNPAIADPVVETSENTVFTLTVTDGNGCSATDEVAVVLGGLLDLEISPDVTICSGSSATLTASGADFYDWSPAGNCLDGPCSSINVSPTTTTVFTVFGHSNDGCLDSARVMVTVTTDEIITNSTVEICEGETAVIHGMEEGEAGIYTFSTMVAGGCDSTSNVELIVHSLPDTLYIDTTICAGEGFSFQGETITETGVYTRAISSTNGCDSTIELTLTVISPDVEIVFAEGDTLLLGDTLEMSILPSSFDSVVWSGGGIAGQCTNLPDCSDAPAENTEYTVAVIDENGCVATAIHQVAVVTECFPNEVVVPNVFTPNGDGKNDLFDIVSKASEEVRHMQVWNRWGKKVYDGPGPWDGNFDGKAAASDVYIYHIVVGCPAGLEEGVSAFKGDVTLLR
ncbi:MAG TPA: gliding motility-associated C-terminal domain-containing protein [Bacteroidetes bacterium]|nr:gliding motility-associated C-terminal domain-containing protein [Bacteroidota bacterium]